MTPEPPPLATVPKGQLKVGADLGTAYLVLVVLDEEGNPLAGEYQFAQVARDGLVVDFVGALDRVTAMKAGGAAAWPPAHPRRQRLPAGVLRGEVLSTVVPERPLFTTPIGIALHGLQVERME